MPRPRRFRMLVWLALTVVLLAWMHAKNWWPGERATDVILGVALIIAAYLACTAQTSAD